MKVKTLQVLWHERKPVLSVDFDPATGLLASCGTDKEIKLWRVGKDADGNPDVTHEETLTAHTKTVNCVRFSPGGDALASGGDAGEVIVWRPAPSDKRVTNQHGDLTSWRTSAVLRGHSDDVQDLAWAPEGAGIVTGSVDNECIVWDVPKAKGALRLQGHTHYVQGVSWDPHGEYVVSQSGDRTARVFASRGMGASHQMLSARWCKHLVCQKVLKSVEEAPDPKNESGGESGGTAGKDFGEKPPRAPLFHDDTMGSFFRRPAWSPCGSFLAVPAGVHRAHAGAKEQHCTYLYARDAFNRPALRLPGIAPAACVRFSPVFYERKGDAFSAKTRPRTPEKNSSDAQCFDAVDAPSSNPGDDTTDAKAPKAHGVSDASGAPNLGSSIDLPFRVLFAVCTTDTVAVYDSGSDAPVAFVGGLHYAAITDAAWSPDGYTLVVSSSDGYCSVLQFSEREIGEPLVPEKLPEHLRRLTPAARVRAAREAAETAERRAAAAAEEAATRAKSKAEIKAETATETAAADAPKRVAPEPVKPVAPEPAARVDDGAAATASFEARAPKRAVPVEVPSDAPPAKAPKRIAPTAL